MRSTPHCADHPTVRDRDRPWRLRNQPRVPDWTDVRCAAGLSTAQHTSSAGSQQSLPVSERSIAPHRATVLPRTHRGANGVDRGLWRLHPRSPPAPRQLGVWGSPRTRRSDPRRLGRRVYRRGGRRDVESRLQPAAAAHRRGLGGCDPGTVDAPAAVHRPPVLLGVLRIPAGRAHPEPRAGPTFPSVFYFTYFTYHVGAIVAACLLVFGCRLYPRHDAIWRVYALTLCWAALAGLGRRPSAGRRLPTVVNMLAYQPATCLATKRPPLTGLATDRLTGQPIGLRRRRQAESRGWEVEPRSPHGPARP